MPLAGPLSAYALMLLLAVSAAACDPEFVVGSWSCPAPGAAEDGSALPVEEQNVPASWKTGFETGSCDYTRLGGFCYADPAATFAVVDSPVHSGRHAAAFSITTEAGLDGEQTRCVRQGKLPIDAVYGAWLYLPEAASGPRNWNLFHFRGGAPDNWHGLWDVSIDASQDGSLFLYVFTALNGGNFFTPSPPVPVPIGSWFHVEFRLRRAADATGSMALYQDEQLLAQADSIVTDDSPSAQWYVGNLAAALTPSDYTLYVDDVTIRTP